MPDAVSVPHPDNPPPGYGPVGAVVQQAGWVGKNVANLTDHQLQRLVLAAMQFATLVLIGFFVWQSNVRQNESEQRHIDDLAQLRRDRSDSEEKTRLDRIAIVGTVLKHCVDQEKIRRDEEAVYRRDMIAVQNKLADAVNALTRKIAGIKDVIEECPMPREKH